MDAELVVTNCACRGAEAFAFASFERENGGGTVVLRGVLDPDLKDYVFFDPNHDYPEIIVGGSVFKRQTALYNGFPWWKEQSGAGAVFKSVKGVFWICNPLGLVEPYSYEAEDGSIHGDGWFEFAGEPSIAAPGGIVLVPAGTYADDPPSIPEVRVRWPRYQLNASDNSTGPFVGLFEPVDDDGTLALDSFLVGVPVFLDGARAPWRLSPAAKRLICSDGRIYAFRDGDGWVIGTPGEGAWWEGPEPDPPSGLTLRGCGVDAEGHNPDDIVLTYDRCEPSGANGSCLLFEVSKWR